MLPRSGVWLATLLSAHLPILMWVFIPFAISVSISQRVLGLHYQPDVAVVTALGVTLTLGSMRLLARERSMTHNPPDRPLKCRSLFISDVHLGSRDASAHYLLDLLRSVETEQLYLVGDIIDLWSLKRSFYWPAEHGGVVRLISSLAQRGTRVIYVPGNHDAAFREYAGTTFGKVAIEREIVHVSASGQRLLVMHGDEFDAAIKCASWLGFVGHYAYDAILWLNRHLNRLRGSAGLPYWSLAAYLKHKAHTARKYIDCFEQAVAGEARRRGLDGVVCGHIHRPKLTVDGGIRYLNCGDWVENCTALIEDHAGAFALIHWSERSQILTSSAVTVTAEHAQAA